MMPVLLDTHVWIWLSVSQNRSLSPAAQKAIRSASEKWISAISCWELAKLVEKKRIGFSIPLLHWIRQSLLEKNLRIADLTPEVAVESTHLNDLHQDPADQIIVATSRILEMPLVTSDRRIRSYSGVECIW
jgi:PIN domain nuclease of toxin-antitoxin system